MLDWYFNLSILTRVQLFFLAGCYCYIMSVSFKSLSRGSYSIGWYRGAHSTPVFQILMWIGALPLIIPAVLIYFKKQKALSKAPFIGNIRSRIFHYRDCEYQKQIQSNFYRSPLFSIEQAHKNFYKKCNFCKPGQ